MLCELHFVFVRSGIPVVMEGLTKIKMQEGPWLIMPDYIQLK